MNFTLKQLRYVEAAGRLGSIAKAAEEMSISQSSITTAIDALEHSLDYDIFLRTPSKGIQPTPSGAKMLQLIRSYMDQTRHFEAEIQSVDSDAAGLVRIAAYATAAPSILPPVLETISREFPGISVKLLEGHMGRVMKFLDEGEADLAFTYEQAVDGRYHFEPLFEAPVYALISKTDPIAKNEGVTFAELSERPFVLLDLPLARESFVDGFKLKGLTCNIAHTTLSSEICRTLVASGFGYTMLNILPPDYNETDLSYRALPILDADWTPVFGIATTAGARQPKTVRAFIESCIKLRDEAAFDAITVKRP